MFSGYGGREAGGPQETADVVGGNSSEAVANIPQHRTWKIFVIVKEPLGTVAEVQFFVTNRIHGRLWCWRWWWNFIENPCFQLWRKIISSAQQNGVCVSARVPLDQKVCGSGTVGGC